MESRPRTSLGRVLEDLGNTLLDLVCGDVDSAFDVHGLGIYDPLDELVLPEQALVLGVGLHGASQIAEVLGYLETHAAAALVVRAPVEPDPLIVKAVRSTGVPLLALTRGASWAQLAALVRALIEDVSAATDSATLGGMPGGDLFALANAISALLDAPVTIEDRNSRVLAFSGQQDDADPSRVQTILGRQVPERVSRILEERGDFQAIYRSERPVFLEALPAADGQTALHRAAIAVRAGDEILGSIWAAIREPLSEERSDALLDASQLVALHLLHQRASLEVERRLTADQLGRALQSGTEAAEAARRLGLADLPGVVLALTLVDASGATSESTSAELVAERKRVADAFAVHLSAVHPRAVAGLIGDVAYGVLPSARGTGEVEERAHRIATDFLSRISPRSRALLAIGPLAPDGLALAQSRAGADRALRVLREGDTDLRLASLSDVRVDSMLLELADIISAREEPLDGPLAILIAYDTKHGGQMVETLAAWLDAFGDVAEASEMMHVHPSTLRYRLRRIAEVAGFDLEDPRSRFGAMLDLYLMRSGGPQLGGRSARPV